MARQPVAVSLVLVILGFATAAFAQSASAQSASAQSTPAPSLPTGTGFVDYYILHAVHGPHWNARTAEEGRKVSLDLIEDLKARLGSEQVTFSGIVTDASGDRIMAIIRTGDEQSMRRTLQESRSVANGIFGLRVQPWHSPKSNWPDPGVNGDGC